MSSEKKSRVKYTKRNEQFVTDLVKRKSKRIKKGLMQSLPKNGGCKKGRTNQPGCKICEEIQPQQRFLKFLLLKIKMQLNQGASHGLVSQKTKLCRYFAAVIRYPQQLQIHRWDQECDVIVKNKKQKNTPNKEDKTSWDLRQGRQLSSHFCFKKQKTKNKKTERHTESLGEGPTLFSLPESRKTVKKKGQPEPDFFFFNFKDGVARQKSAHKNFIKKVVVWGFFSR